jgi:hypothetical protein
MNYEVLVEDMKGGQGYYNCDRYEVVNAYGYPVLRLHGAGYEQHTFVLANLVHYRILRTGN